MNLKRIIKDITEETESKFYMYRMFNNCPEVKTVINRMNELIAQNPDTMDVVTALFIYPALKWVVKGNDSVKRMKTIYAIEDRYKRFETVKKIVEESTGLHPKLLLENREAYFNACEDLIALVDKSIETIKDFPVNGGYYEEVLSIFTAESECEDRKSNRKLVSNINKYLKDAVTKVYELYAEEYEDVLDRVLYGKPPADDESQFVYHNVNLLLQEYRKIVWYAKHSEDITVRLTACKTEEEMIAITKKDAAFADAYLISEYSILIGECIELVRQFPYEGEDYYAIINAIINKKTKNVTNEEIAKSLGVSSCNYTIKKRRALSVLGAILWGCDADAFIELLTRAK